MVADAPLPDFEKPPLQEVALSVQFEPLGALRTPQLGLLWRRLRSRFPSIEEQPPLPPVIERFGNPASPPRRILIDIEDSVLTPRVLMVSEQGTELIQVQQDRFVHNWRKLEESQTYPRYEHGLRQAFVEALTEFQHFLGEEALGEIEGNQCEVTYVNRISLSEADTLADLLVMLNYDEHEDFLPSPEDSRFGLRFVMRGASDEPLGRLHVSAEPRIRLSDGERTHRLTLTARGAPLGAGTEGILKFLDLGREWIVRGFTSLTTPQMHDRWKRRL